MWNEHTLNLKDYNIKEVRERERERECVSKTINSTSNLHVTRNLCVGTNALQFIVYMFTTYHFLE